MQRTERRESVEHGVGNMMNVNNKLNERNVSEDRTIYRERLKAGGLAKWRLDQQDCSKKADDSRGGGTMTTL